MTKMRIFLKHKEKLTGKLDFDYENNELVREFETYSVKCSAQLKNYLTARVTSTYDALASEFPKMEYRQIADHSKDDPIPDVKTVWWTETKESCDSERTVTSEDLFIQRYYDLWLKYHDSDTSVYGESHAKNAEVGSFYAFTKLPIITPSNAKHFVTYLSRHLDFSKFKNLWWTWLSYSEDHLVVAHKESQVVLFPVHARYGWNLNTKEHRQLLTEIDNSLRPAFTMIKVTCGELDHPRYARHAVSRIKRDEKQWSFVVQYFITSWLGINYLLWRKCICCNTGSYLTRNWRCTFNW